METRCRPDGSSTPTELHKGHVCGRGDARLQEEGEHKADEKAAIVNVNLFKGSGSRWKGRDEGQIKGEARSRETCSPWFRRSFDMEMLS